MTTHQIFDVRIHDISVTELSSLIYEWLHGIAIRSIVTPNPEFILLSRCDPEFREQLSRADLSLPDGVGIRFAIPAMTGSRLEHRHTGIDTLELIARECAASRVSLRLLGGDPGIADRAANSLRLQLSELDVRGVDPGRVHPNTIDPDVLLKLRDATVVAVGLGQGKQERFMESLRAIAPTELPSLRILIGVGGAFDMLSGIRRRAPAWMRSTGLEWIWRVVIEPKRILRILRAFLVFPGLVVWDTLKRRRFLRACTKVIPEIIRQLRGL
jgi:N-acetylglucosaminyldiphosphoundecaprenol N-acetyl-beta-D-mannosaminyltransferase